MHFLLQKPLNFVATCCPIDLNKKSYEKQLKDMKNMCDKYSSELNLLKKDGLGNQSSSQVDEQNKLSSQNRNDAISDLLHKTEEDRSRRD